jgi:hypothetical protein
MIPASVIMEDRDSKSVDILGGFDDRDLDYVGFSRQEWAGDQNQRDCQRWGESHAIGTFFWWLARKEHDLN